MVTVANQQMDPEKAKLSSIDRGEQAPDFIGTPKTKVKKFDGRTSAGIEELTGVKQKQQITSSNKLGGVSVVSEKKNADGTWSYTLSDGSTSIVKEQIGPDGQIQPTEVGTKEYTRAEKYNSIMQKSGSYYNDVYLPKKQLEQSQKQGEIQNVETPAPSKAQTMDTTTLAQAYDMGDVSAIDLENLKQTDPLKYQETKLEIERKRTLDLINQSGKENIETIRQLNDSYLKKWDEISASDEGKTLREEVFAKYGLNESNEKIKKYSTEIDRLDEELEKVNDVAFSADAFADRGRRTTAMRELTKQRNDTAKLRASEIDYYRLGLEQADAVVADYKEYKAQELAQLGVKFEMMTGMSQMEFEAEQKQLALELADIDKYISKIETSQAEELKYTRELEKEDREFKKDVFLEDLKFERDIQKAMTMAEVDFGYDVQLQKMSFSNQMAMANFDASTKLGLLRASKELDMMFPEYQYKEVEIDGVKTTVAVNPYDPTDYKAINTNLSKDYFSNIGSGKVTSRGGQHDGFQGVDIDGKMGDPIPTLGGKVVKVVTGQGKSSTPSYGNYVDVQDENGYIHRYAHLNDVNVEEGQTIPKGFTLGTIGNSGYTISGAGGDGSHLDYSVKRADGNFMKSSEIPGYLSTLQTPEALPQPIQELFGILQNIKDGSSGFHGAVGFKGFINKGIGFVTGTTDEGLPIGTPSASFAKRVEQLKNILAFDNLDKLKGAMSDNDLKFLKSINTSISIDMTEKEFVKELERVENSLLTKYGTTLPQALNLPDFDKEEITPASSYLSLKK